MEEACQMVEKIVNEVLAQRPRYSLEWGGIGTVGQAWKANVAASNCYTGTPIDQTKRDRAKFTQTPKGPRKGWDTTLTN